MSFNHANRTLRNLSDDSDPGRALHVALNLRFLENNVNHRLNRLDECYIIYSMCAKKKPPEQHPHASVNSPEVLGNEIVTGITFHFVASMLLSSRAPTKTKIARECGLS